MAKLHPIEVEQKGLTALVLCDGSARRAAKLLEETGEAPIAYETLRDWKTSKAAELAEIHEQVLPELRKRFGHRAGALYGRLLEIQEKLAAKVEDNLDELSTLEASKAIQPIAVSAGIALDKHYRLHDEPAFITAAGRDTEELWAALQRIVAPHTVDSTAVEDATVVDDGAATVPPSAVRVLAPRPQAPSKGAREPSST